MFPLSLSPLDYTFVKNYSPLANIDTETDTPHGNFQV